MWGGQLGLIPSRAKDDKMTRVRPTGSALRVKPSAIGSSARALEASLSEVGKRDLSDDGKRAI